VNCLRLDRTKLAVEIIERLRKAADGMVEPAATQIVKKFGKNPYLVLMSCILSLRTKDAVSLPASIQLFAAAKTPKEMVRLPAGKIEKIIYSVGFYRQKARSLREISKDLIERFGGKVPNNEQDLLSLKGVGQKTANLVLGEGFGIPAICVDTHVHKISNRLGLVKTKTPDETEQALKKILPREYWIEFNGLLVKWGQNICVAISPFCSKCALYGCCRRVGVTKNR